MGGIAFGFRGATLCCITCILGGGRMGGLLAWDQIWFFFCSEGRHVSTDWAEAGPRKIKYV
jgi:hypothetical protein